VFLSACLFQEVGGGCLGWAEEERPGGGEALKEESTHCPLYYPLPSHATAMTKSQATVSA